MPRYKVIADEKEYDVELKQDGELMTAIVNGKRYDVQSHPLGGSRSLLLIDNRSHEIDIRSKGNKGERIVFMQGVEIPVTIEDYRLAELRLAAGIKDVTTAERQLKSPMPGLILKVKVEVGQMITKGQPLVVIEAMKMENVIKARFDGQIAVINVQSGQIVEQGTILMEFTS